MKTKKLSLKDFESVEMSELLHSKGGTGGGSGGGQPRYRCKGPYNTFWSFIPCSQIGGGYTQV